MLFLFLVATCIFGTYLQNGDCVVSCANGTIGDSDTQQCRNVMGELIVLVNSSIAHTYVYSLYMNCVCMCACVCTL